MFDDFINRRFTLGWSKHNVSARSEPLKINRSTHFNQSRFSISNDTLPAFSR